jgi:hypothetical protein
LSIINEPKRRDRGTREITRRTDKTRTCPLLESAERAQISAPDLTVTTQIEKRVGEGHPGPVLGLVPSDEGQILSDRESLRGPLARAVPTDGIRACRVRHRVEPSQLPGQGLDADRTPPNGRRRPSQDLGHHTTSLPLSAPAGPTMLADNERVDPIELLVRINSHSQDYSDWMDSAVSFEFTVAVSCWRHNST